MKLFIFYVFIGFAAVLSVGICRVTADDFIEADAHCKKENDISEEEFETMMTALQELEDERESNSESDSEGDSNNDNDGDDSESDEMTQELRNFAMKFKCYAHCLLEELELLNEEDKIDLEVFKKMDDISDSSMETIQDCKTLHDPEEDACEYSFKVLACIGISLVKE